MNVYQNTITGERKEVQPWQLELKPCDFYVIDEPFASVGSIPLKGLPRIYGHILRQRAEGFFWVKAYSAWCPHGESGEMCIVDPSRKITEEEFNQARQQGWP